MEDQIENGCPMFGVKYCYRLILYALQNICE